MLEAGAAGAVSLHSELLLPDTQSRSETSTFTVNILQDDQEHPMVRHEAAEALAAIADESCIGILQDFASCEQPVVADSCIVALDVIAHEQSGAFEYADTGES